MCWSSVVAAILLYSTVATDLISKDRCYWRPQDNQLDAELMMSGLVQSSPEGCVLDHRLGVSMVPSPAPNITSCAVLSSDFLLLTVATEETDGYLRFIRSTKVYNVPTKVLGLGQQWKGGDMKGPGGGHKVLMLRKALKLYASDINKIIMFTDSYDVVILAPPSDILEQFRALDARMVFAAELNCWPDRSLADQYPVTESRYKYLNSGGIIGYASDLYELLSSHELKASDDDQLYFTKLFLNKTIRENHRMKLDHKAAIFQNLYEAQDDVDIVQGTLLNVVYGTKPLVFHGNGRSKLELNTLANYLADYWTAAEGCIGCRENNIEIQKIPEADYPTVVIAVHVAVPTPFIREAFDKILQLDYPKNKIYFFIANSVEHHNKDVELLKDNINTFEQYLGIKMIKSEDEIREADARMFAVDYCLAKECDYLLSVDSFAHLDNPNTLKALIKLNRTLVAPMLVRPHKAWSNFWGAITQDGFYSRSFDYMDIVNNNRRGVWNVPYISAAYLTNATLLRRHKPRYDIATLDSDMAFCHYYREKDVFMYVSNLEEYGHLVDPDNYDPSRIHPDMYELLTNRQDWEQRYISPEYPENFNPNRTAEQPCPDVYWFPVVTPEFCQSLIDIMENFGKWSDGTNTDNRLTGGYENVPTRDIHMNQVGYDQTWMEFLRLYVRPLQEHVFLGYFHDDSRIEGGYENVPTRDIHMKQVGLEMVWNDFLVSFVSPLQQTVFIGYEDPPKSLMNFVVRYRPDEQPSLRPHHDSSTYTINLALNRPNVDYQGGGCRFLRYNCSVTDTRVGWMLMHPGRLTHFHEGLRVTNGTRYIMISFVDP